MALQPFLFVDFSKLGSFSPNIVEYPPETVSTPRMHLGATLFPSAYLNSAFMNFMENVIYHQINGSRLVYAGQYADEDDESFHQDDDDENVYDASVLHPIVSARNASPELQASFASLFKPSPVRYFYAPDRNEFIDKWDVPEGVNKTKIHPLPILLITGSIEEDDEDFTIGSTYEMECKGDIYNENFIGAWAGDSIIALDDSLESMLFLSVSRATKIDPGFRHIPLEESKLEFDPRFISTIFAC